MTFDIYFITTPNTSKPNNLLLYRYSDGKKTKIGFQIPRHALRKYIPAGVYPYIVYQNKSAFNANNLTPHVPVYISTHFFALGFCLPTITDSTSLFKIIKGKI